MTMDSFRNECIAVLVGRQHYQEFMQLCEDDGILWTSGEFPTTQHIDLTESTCVDFDLDRALGWHGDSNRGLMYADEDYYREHDYKVVTYDEFILGYDGHDVVKVDDNQLIAMIEACSR